MTSAKVLQPSNIVCWKTLYAEMTSDHNNTWCPPIIIHSPSGGPNPMIDSNDSTSKKLVLHNLSRGRTTPPN